jgi:hypothetical protein
MSGCVCGVWCSIKKHITDPRSNRLLIFPEGVCVNNEYVVQFKKTAFDMGAVVCPIAIKYKYARSPRPFLSLSLCFALCVVMAKR